MDYDLLNVAPRPTINLTVNITYNNMQHCPSCKLDSVTPNSQCYRCHFRPRIDCPKCLGDNTLAITNGVYSTGGAPLQCVKCDFQEPVDSYLHHTMGDAPTFTDMENEPEERKSENYSQYTAMKQQSRKHRAQHQLANRLLKTPEENLFDSLHKGFKQSVERYYSLLLSKNLRFGQPQMDAVVKGCLEGLKAYVSYVQRESKKNRELYVPQKQQLEVMRGAVAQDYYHKHNYTAVDFKSDSKRFQHRVVHPPPQLHDGQPHEHKRFRQWLALEQDIGFMQPLIDQASGEERDRLQMVRLEMMQGYDQYTADTLRFKHRVVRSTPQLNQGQPTELEAFAKWLGYRDQVESFTRQIAHLHHKIGRVSDQIHNVEHLAAACLFVHLESHAELLLFKDLSEFYCACTGLKAPEAVQNMAQQIKVQLGIKPLSLFEQMKRSLQMIKRDLTNIAGVEWSEHDDRISLLLPVVQNQLEEINDKLRTLEPKHVAAAVLLNSLKEMKGKWNAKFIAEHVPMLGNASKITEAAAAMKHKVSLLCKVVDNKK